MMFALSLLPVVLSSLFISFRVTGSPTQDSGSEAIWKPLSVQSTIEEDSATVNDVSLELFKDRKIMPEKPSGPLPLSNKTGATVARTKCNEYSRAHEKLPPETWRVSGGTMVYIMEHPHMAAVGFNSSDGVLYRCGGSLISERFVLTAAHCTFKHGLGAATWVRLGDLNLNRTDDMANPREFRIIDRIRHHEYRAPFKYHDIALLKLESAVTFDAWVSPICLPYSEPDTCNEEAATATGWGHVNFEDEVGSNDILKVTIKFVNNTRCNQSYKNGFLPRGIVDDWQICAGGEPGKDTCQGDSGGPLVITNREYNWMHTIIGVINFGEFCGSRIPGVYSRVSNYIPWIVQTVWPELV